MSIPFRRIAPLMRRNLRWMRESVQKSFDAQLNVSAIHQVCCYTEALSRLRVGTVDEWPTDGMQVFHDFLEAYFVGFRAAAHRLGKFWINRDRGRKTGKPWLADAYEAFYLLYRHGLVHEYLQKAGSMITRTSDDGEHPYLWTQPNRRGVLDPQGHLTRKLHVHLDPLVEDFSRAVGNYEEALFDLPGRRELQRACRRRYEFILR